MNKEKPGSLSEFITGVFSLIFLLSEGELGWRDWGQRIGLHMSYLTLISLLFMGMKCQGMLVPPATPLAWWRKETRDLHQCRDGYVC